MNPGDSTWWWTHAFDAIASGLVTALAVLLTLRHDRRRGEAAEIRSAISTLEGAIWEVSTILRGNVEQRRGWSVPSTKMWIELRSTAAVARRRYPTFADDLGVAQERWWAIVDGREDDGAPVDALDDLSGSLFVCLGRWRHDPKGYKPLGAAFFEMSKAVTPTHSAGSEGPEDPRP